MNTLRRRLPQLKLAGVLLLFAGVQLIGLPKRVAAGSEGCVRSAAPARPGGDGTHPRCDPQDNGPFCYQCAEQPGDFGSDYTICSQYQNGTGAICGDFEALPGWFGMDPDNQDPGFGSLG